MSDQDLIRLSQSHLNLLSICPPKFQQIYLDGLGSLTAPEQHDSMQWGNRFHLLMQQRELTLPIESLLATDSELDRSLKALVEAAPELKPNPNIWREAEHCRTLTIDNFLFTVIYDLLIAQTDQVIILDWKTYRQPIGTRKLQQNWQTRLYLYVLAETSEYKPEQIQMTYWFVKSGTPKKITIKYDAKKHQQTAQELQLLLANLKIWLQDYQNVQTNFPHHRDCQNCRFHSDFVAVDSEATAFESIDDIEEVII